MSDHFKNIFMKWNDHQWKILLRWSVSYLMSSATETLRRHLQMWLTEGCLLLAVTWFSPPLLPNFWGLAILQKSNTETCVYNTKFGIVTIILYRILCPTKRDLFQYENALMSPTLWMTLHVHAKMLLQVWSYDFLWRNVIHWIIVVPYDKPKRLDFSDKNIAEPGQPRICIYSHLCLESLFFSPQSK